MKKYIIQILIIFITLIVISNYLLGKAENKSPNSLYVKDIDDSVFLKDVSFEGNIENFTEDICNNLILKNYDYVYNKLSQESKKKYNYSIDSFKKDILENYFDSLSSYYLSYMGYDEKNQYYVYLVEIAVPQFLSEEEKERKVYNPKSFFIGIYQDESGNYTIEWDYDF